MKGFPKLTKVTRQKLHKKVQSFDDNYNAVRVIYENGVKDIGCLSFPGRGRGYAIYKGGKKWTFLDEEDEVRSMEFLGSLQLIKIIEKLKREKAKSEKKLQKIENFLHKQFSQKKGGCKNDLLKMQ
jgi:hypothetical protein